MDLEEEDGSLSRGKFHQGGPPTSKGVRSLGKGCEGAKGEGDEGEELDPATQSRKALV